MAITLEQHVSVNGTTASSGPLVGEMLTGTLPSAPKAGELLLISYAWNQNGGNATVGTPSGWTAVPTDGDVSVSSKVHHAVFYRVADGSETYLVTGVGSGQSAILSVGGQTYVAFVLHFHDTTGGAWLLDKSAHNSNSSSSSLSSGTTATTTAAVEAWVAFFGNQNVNLPTSPTNSFLSIDTDASPGSASGSKVAGGTFYKVVSSTGTASTSVSLSASRAWVASIATFRVVASGAADMSGTGSETVAGVRKGLGAATLAAISSSTTAGSHTGYGAAALVGTGTLSASGSQRGAAALTGAGTLSAVGARRILDGAAAIVGLGSSTTNGGRQQNGIAHLAGVGSIAAFAISPTTDISPESTGSLTLTPSVTGSLSLSLAATGSLSLVPAAESGGFYPGEYPSSFLYPGVGVVTSLTPASEADMTLIPA